jgi:hypothetical protein
VGVFTGDPSVDGRMRAFDDAVEKLLWPSKRAGKASIRVTTRPTFVEIPGALVPGPLRTLIHDGALRIGPIPRGTPVKLVANIAPDPRNLFVLIPLAKAAWNEAAGRQADVVFADVARTLAPALMAASTCPDLIEDRGHEFGADLSDTDKRALIEFLKTL